jgi:neutral trehalase
MYDFAIRLRKHQEVTTVNGKNEPVVVRRTCDGRYEGEIYPLDYWTVMKGYASTNSWDRVQDGLDFFTHNILQNGYPFNGAKVAPPTEAETTDQSLLVNYYAGRTQPPTYFYMVRLLGEHLGEAVYAHGPYVRAMENLWRHFNPEPELLEVQPRGQFHAFKRGGVSEEGLPFSVYGDDTNNGRKYEDYIGRLESFEEDEETARLAAERVPLEDRARVRADTLVHLLAEGETGWDMSISRYAGGIDLSHINTTNIVPIELQCMLADGAEMLAYSYGVKMLKAAEQGDYQAAATFKERHLYFTDQRTKRIEFINTYMRDPKTGAYHDLELVNPSSSYDRLRSYQSVRRTPVISAAMLHTLYSGVTRSAMESVMVTRIARDTLLGLGGLAVTNMEGEQWDKPNAWASPDRAGVSGPIHASARFFHEDPELSEELAVFAEDVQAATLRGSKRAFKLTKTIVETIHAFMPWRRPRRGEYPKDLKNPNTPRNFSMQAEKIIDLTRMNVRERRDRLVRFAGRFAVAFR